MTEGSRESSRSDFFEISSFLEFLGDSILGPKIEKKEAISTSNNDVAGFVSFPLARINFSNNLGVEVGSKID